MPNRNNSRTNTNRHVRRSGALTTHGKQKKSKKKYAKQIEGIWELTIQHKVKMSRER